MAKGTAKQGAGARASEWHVTAIEVARIVAVVVAVVALVALLWFARTALLLLFASVFLAVLFDGLCRPLVRRGLPKPVALSLVLSVGVVLILLLAMTAGPAFIQQLQELGRNLSETLATLGQQAATEAGQGEGLRQVDWWELISLLPSPLGIATGATAVATTIIGAAASI